MANLLIAGRHYPVSIMRYFKNAFRELGHNIWSAGTYSATIPWNTSKDYSSILDIPNFIVPNGDSTFTYPVEPVLEACEFVPDAIINFDSFFHLLNVKNTGLKNAYVMSDPHACEAFYMRGVEHYEKHFCMQGAYAHNYETKADGTQRPVWTLPYAADPRLHYWNGKDFTRRPYDVCILSGLLYQNRKMALDIMRYEGLNVYQDSAVFYPEASEVYGEAVIAFNWSSAEDLCARFWEGLATRNLVLTNRVPDLAMFSDLKEDEHYVVYDSMDECIAKAVYYSQNRAEAWRIASAGYAMFWAGDHSWKRRADMILDVIGLK